MPKIIGLVGFIGSGKGTVGDYLKDEHNFVQDSFARPLKDATAAIFDWDREMLEGASKESRHQREQIDQWWANNLNIPNFTPRFALQQLGTEVLRENFHDKIWILSLTRRALSRTQSTVVTDCRFRNEMDKLRQLGGVIVRVKSGPEPKYFHYAAMEKNGDITPGYMAHYFPSVHKSEWDWIGGPIDYTIYNEGGLNELYDNIEEMLKNV